MGKMMSLASVSPSQSVFFPDNKEQMAEATKVLDNVSTHNYIADIYYDTM